MHTRLDEHITLQCFRDTEPARARYWPCPLIIYCALPTQMRWLEKGRDCRPLVRRLVLIKIFPLDPTLPLEHIAAGKLVTLCYKYHQ